MFYGNMSEKVVHRLVVAAGRACLSLVHADILAVVFSLRCFSPVPGWPFFARRARSEIRWKIRGQQLIS